MTPKEIIDRYFREFDAEAERYRDKQMDEPKPEREVLRIEHMLGDVVYLKVAENPVPGMVTNIELAPGIAVYHVTWGDTRESRPHYAIELTTERSFS